MYSAHQLSHILRRPPHLGKCQTALNTLKKLAGDLVAHHMAPLAVVQLLARASLVDTHHGHTDGPGRLADAQSQVSVIGIDISPLLGRFDNFNHGFQDAVVQIALFEFAEQLFLPR